MNYRMIARVLGWILLIYAALMLLPLAAGLWYGESVLNFLVTIGLTAALGGLLLLPKPRTNSLVARDGFVIVGIGWIAISLLGALPFVISGSIPHYVDALFETASGPSFFSFVFLHLRYYLDFFSFHYFFLSFFAILNHHYF